MKVKKIEKLSSTAILMYPRDILNSIKMGKRVHLPHIDDEELVPLWFALTGNMNYSMGAFEYEGFTKDHCKLLCVNIKDVKTIREDFLNSIISGKSFYVEVEKVKAEYDIPPILEKIKVVSFTERPIIIERLKHGIMDSLEQKMNDIEKYQMNIIAI